LKPQPVNGLYNHFILYQRRLVGKACRTIGKANKSKIARPQRLLDIDAVPRISVVSPIEPTSRGMERTAYNSVGRRKIRSRRRPIRSIPDATIWAAMSRKKSFVSARDI
jgi:hypothetical protein